MDVCSPAPRGARVPCCGGEHTQEQGLGQQGEAPTLGGESGKPESRGFSLGRVVGKRIVFQISEDSHVGKDRLAQLGGSSRGRTVPKVQGRCPRMKI